MSKMTRLSYSRAAARAVDQRRLDDDVDGRVEAINVLERSGDKNLLQTAKKRLYDLDIIRISGARIRSKELYFSEFEKSSRYFFSLENKRQQRKVISSLSSRDGSIVTEPAEILKQISSFYSDLFSSDETDDGCQRFLLDSICLSLPDDVRDTLEVPISSEECFKMYMGQTYRETQLAPHSMV
eukprot:gene14852-16392_t